MIKEYLDARKHLRDEVQKIIGEADEQQVEAEFKAFHKRRALQIEGNYKLLHHMLSCR